ncbi:UDP-3-O-(3-hydroxymyristoyl)glucosamine N-acyltransferase [Phascolarctobacterium succinatutens]|uniref:UDP-3-O-acylglucosamine N-acyltransferase n=2 Tax=Phascolarctobacterium succinatutens TaxID=626940 RepID=A0A1Q6RAL1_9FIRM|nr:UDP-3-O-(3-hydroxymyristoyl)glucosamine N-acyltransferase [Phascolarctobacterium succinatutens]MBS1361840.1 UDP-3-O-(3-hydroxymyristoyl)glucosamine N-acyltransferase [Acidaminococcaceae bacterium]MBS5425561.1 UDP-3-O-(3-hydroxymyristoyl)glucosamine N-acyltransferase [Phascolarctobacterium succinatutens]OLA39389.1 MAG: UDP-3-O-(3-hydroxymyristoyl)glucosamine N-acyltransferase [Phascolarctobacterium succinatutens]
MEKSVQELAEFLKGTVEHDNPELRITGVNGLVEAGPKDISFAVPPHVEHCHLSKAGVMVLSTEDPELDGRPVIRVANPRAAFAALLELFRPQEEVERVISPYAYVSKKAKIGSNVAIQPFAVVEDDAEIGDGCVIYPHAYVGKRVKMGKDCTLYPNTTIREDCVLGDRVILQSGSVIGGDGFGYITQNGKHSKVLQTGNVVLQDDVEIGNNTCIDRATVDSTIVGKGTKIDNLVHLGHNDILGENCLVVAHVGISGSVTVGNNVTFAGQVGTVGHITIGSNCVFGGKTGITNNVPDNSVMGGFPAMPMKEWLRQEANLRKVGDMLKRVKALEKELAELKK